MNVKKLILLILLLPVSSFAQQKVEVFFDFDKYNLNDVAISKLNTWIAEKKAVQVTKIYGYCDWKGTNFYNDTLSKKRVNEVFIFLKKNEINISKDYQIKGFGEDFEQSKIQADNRKVTIIFEDKVIPQVVEKTPSISLSEKVKASKIGDKIKLKNINFKNYSAVIVPNSKETLYDLLCVMEENPNLKIEIQGHICCQTIEGLYDVSTARARAIYVFLIQNKIDRKRLSYVGFGIKKPIFPIPEKNEEEENSNRRVEIMIVAN